jgi:hypothetical protein
MPRLNAHGAAVMGIGGEVSIDQVVYAHRGTNAQWLTDDTIICQCADTGVWMVSVCKVGQPFQWIPYADKGCNTLAAGGGLWQAHLNSVACFGEYGSLPDYSLGLTDNDARGYAGPGGEINLIPAGGLGIEIHSRSGVTPIPFGPARDVQVLGPASAIWRDDAGVFYTQGVPCPAQASGGSSPRYCLFPDGSAWIVYFAGAYGLIAHPVDDATSGVLLVPPGQPAFYPDARVVNGALVACWSTGAGEYPGELVVVRDVLALPRVEFGAAPEPPNPEPPNPEPPNPEPPEPPMSLVYDFGPCQQFADQRWPQMPHSTGHEQSANMATILYELRAMGHPFEMFLKDSGQSWHGWDGQNYSEDVCVVVQDGAKWWKDIIVRCGAPDAYISFGNAHDYQRPNPPSDEAKCVPPPTPPDAPAPIPPTPEPPVYGTGYLRTDFGDYLRAKKKTGELERGEAQLLTLADEGDGRVSIRIGGSGKYVCADPNVPDDPLMANRDSVGPWERFDVTTHADGTISLTAEGSGFDVCVEDSGKVTARGKATFTFEPD